MDETFIIKLACLGLFFAAFVAILTWAIGAARKKKQQMRQTALEFGYQPVYQPPEALLCLFSLEKPDPEGLEWKSGFHKRLAECDLYLPDMHYKDSNSRDSVEQDNLALLSPSLNLPEFILFVKDERWLESSSMLLSLAESMITTTVNMSGRMQRVTFPEHKDFDQQVICLSTGKETLQDWFTPEVQAAILRSQIGSLRGAGRALAVSLTSLAGARTARVDTSQKTLMNLEHAAQRLAQVLEQAAPAYVPPASSLRAAADSQAALEQTADQASVVQEDPLEAPATSRIAALLQGPRMFEPGLLIFGLGLLVFGLMFLVFMGGTTELTCRRVQSSSIQCTRQVSLFMIPLRSASIENLRGASVDESCDSEGCTYQVMLHTSAGTQGFTDYTSSGYRGKEDTASRINTFVRNPNETNFSIKEYNLIGQAVVGVFLLAGGLMLFKALFDGLVQLKERL